MAPQFVLREPQRIPKKRSYGFLLLLIAALAATTWIIFVQLPVSAGVSAFCGKACHSMNPAYQSWRRSDHAKTACLNCHSDGSKTDKFIKLIELSAKHIRKETIGPYRPIKVADSHAVPDRTCLGCHEPKKRAKANGRIIDHQAHEAFDLRCRDCHNRGPHEDAQEYPPIAKTKKAAYKNYMTMREGCWRCHKEKGKFITPDGKTIVGPFRTAKATASTDCQTCHAGFDMRELKKSVEAVWLRHVKQPPWRQGTVHGEAARKADFQPCKVCHNPDKRCAVCHNGVKMPHDDNWLVARKHGTAAKATEGAACQMCHKLKEVPKCSANGHHHEEWVVGKKIDLLETPWKSGAATHGPIARETNAKPCLRCHNQATWCAKCHNGIKMPHGPEWRKTHFTVVGYKPGDGWKPKPTPCDICHNPTGKDIWFCIRCHHQALVPPELAKESNLAVGPMYLGRRVYGLDKRLTGGTGPCAKCHAYQFCWRCHESFSD